MSLIRSAATLILICLTVVAPSAQAAVAPAHPAPGSAQQSAENFTYSDLLTSIRAGAVRSAKLHPATGTVDVQLKDGQRERVQYPLSDGRLGEQLAASGAEVSVDNQAAPEGFSLMRVLPTVLFLAVLLVVFLVIRSGMRHARDKQREFSRMSGGEVRGGEIPAVRFTDVAGCEEVVDSLEEIMLFLSQPQRFTRLGARMPRGVILHGPPGTGKTLLAKALAGEAGVPYFAVSGSEFVEMFVGRGAARVRELFGQARRSARGAVIFIDEIDAVGKRRGDSASASNDEREQTLNQILVEMDGFAALDRIVCLAATNRLDTLDPALLRPGRFGTHLHVDLPAEEGRLRILEVHARSKALADDVDLQRLAKVTYGSSGAELADMLNRAAILAARDEAKAITQAHIEDGYLDAIAGPRKRSAVSADGEREIVAVHEAGHVLCAELCPHVEKAQRVSIQQRGRAGGLAVYGRTDRALQSQQYLHEKLICALGGRAAEFVSKGQITSGAASDLQYANAMARQAVEELGFSTKAGQLVSSQSGQPIRVSDQTAALVDEEIRELVEAAYQDAVRLLQTHSEELHRLADALLDAEDLDRVEIVACLSAVAQTPRAKPRQARGGPRHVPEPQPAVLADRRERRQRRSMRARLAAALLRDNPRQTVRSTD
jgi:cell division protease FtsH